MGIDGALEEWRIKVEKDGIVVAQNERFVTACLANQARVKIFQGGLKVIHELAVLKPQCVREMAQSPSNHSFGHDKLIVTYLRDGFSARV